MTTISEGNISNYATVTGEGQMAISDHLPPLPAKMELGVLIRCHGNGTKVLMNGKWHLLDENDILFVTMGCVLERVETSSRRFDVVYVARAELFRTSLRYNPIELMRKLYATPVLHLTPEGVDTYNGFMHLFHVLAHRGGDNAYHRQSLAMLADSYMYEMLAQLTADGVQGKLPPSLFRSFMELVERERGKLRTVNEAAERLHVSPKYLAHVVKECSGITTSQWLDIFTIQTIAHQLRYTDTPIKTIAGDLGFPNTSAFGTYVRHHIGMPPGAWRNKNRVDKSC